MISFFPSLYIKAVINHCVTEENFIADFKKAEVSPLYKNDGRADQLVFFLMFQKYMKEVVII